MKILHTSDWHLGKSLEGYSRLDEQQLFLNDFIKTVHENDIQVVIIAGDIYDTSNPPARAENMFYDALKKISDNGKIMTIIIAGNHDNPERLSAAGPLAREHGIVIFGTPKTVIQPGIYGKNKIVSSAEGIIEVEIGEETAIVAAVAYPSEKRLNEALYSDMDDETKRHDSYNLRLKALFDKLSQNYRDDTINILISHIFTAGSEEAGSERSIQLGGSLSFDASLFPEKAQYIALGHIHKPQTVQGTDKRARYSGAPLHYSKKEVHYKNKCYIADIKPAEPANITEIPVKIYKPIEVWRFNDIESAIDYCCINKDKLCWTYLEIKTDRYIREDEIKKMREYKADIIEILPIIENDNQIAVTEKMQDKKIDELFKDFYLKQRGMLPQEDIMNLLMDILAEEE